MDHGRVIDHDRTETTSPGTWRASKASWDNHLPTVPRIV
jgi:hypothetical protein